jgi:hypothetical protein
MSEPIHARAPIGASVPSRWGIILAVVIAAGVLVWHFNRSPSEAARLSSAVRTIHPDADCGRVGVIAFAGARSNLYRCGWAGGNACEVWAGGANYDVTTTARLVFRAQGVPSPC